MNDELRNRIRKSDPFPPDVPVDPVDGRRARALVEEIMQTDPRAEVEDREASPRSRLRWLAAAAAAVVVLVGAVVVTTGDDDGDQVASPDEELALELPGGDSLSSCLAFDVAFLAEMPMAFAGTVEELTETEARIAVDHWYRGGEAAVVTLQLPPGLTSLALDGVDLVEGQRYLVTADQGRINGCGFSGPATPDLEAAFAEAFGS